VYIKLGTYIEDVVTFASLYVENKAIPNTLDPKNEAIYI
jgi:hypothetical protein